MQSVVYAQNVQELSWVRTVPSPEQDHKTLPALLQLFGAWWTRGWERKKEREQSSCSKSTSKLLQEQDRELEAYLRGKGTGPHCARLGWNWESGGNKIFFKLQPKAGVTKCVINTDIPTHCTWKKPVNIPFYLSWMNYPPPLLSLAQSLRFRHILSDSDQCSLIYWAVIEIIQNKSFHGWHTNTLNSC